MRIISVIEDQKVVDKVLGHLGRGHYPVNSIDFRLYSSDFSQMELTTLQEET